MDILRIATQLTRLRHRTLPTPPILDALSSVGTAWPCHQRSFVDSATGTFAPWRHSGYWIPTMPKLIAAAVR